MEKSNIIQSIVSKLEKVGIYPKIGQEADIAIEKDFLDAKYSTGEKKITYTGFALLDDASKVLYYYEKTKEESKGFSYGSDSESSFQTGTTLFRKVKSVGYAPDGKAYEYEIDIGQITKIFKETAKENGWKFKTVLSPKKAQYGVVVGGANLASVNANVAPNEESKNEEVVLGQSNGVGSTQVENKFKAGTNKNEVVDKSKGLSLIFIIAIIISILYLLILSASILGWIITTIILLIVIKKRDVIKGKSLIKRAMIWILIFIIIFFVGAFTMPDNDSKKSTDQKTTNEGQNNNVANTNKVADEKTPYYITGESYSVLNGYDYVTGSDYKQIKPYTSANILISINNSNLEQNKEIKSIIIKNAKVTKAPKMGTPQFYFYDIITENSTSKTSEKHPFNNNSFEYSVGDFGKLQAVQFYYAVTDIKTQDVSGWSVIESDKAIVKSGITSEDVRSSISFEIEITNVNNKKYSMVFSQELFSGDFLNDSTSRFISKYYYNDDIKYFLEK